MNILTNDPSFTAWGWAVLDVKGSIKATGCIKTAPEYKKKRIRVSDDRASRAADITMQLLEIIHKYDVGFMLSEAPHGSQNANAAVMIGITLGVTTTLSECLNIPIEYYSEQDAKKALLGKRAATKDETIKAIDKLYDVYWCKTKYVDEAVADALAIHHVAMQQSPTLKIMRK